MAQTVSFDFKNAKAMATDADIAAIKDQVVAAKATLVNKTGEGNDFLGWIDLPVDYDKEEFQEGSSQDSGRFRRARSNRYRWFLPGCKSSHRSFKTQLL